MQGVVAVQPGPVVQFLTSRVPVTVRIATHAPVLHAWPVPHAVPSGLLVNGPTQAGPVEHDTVPVWHAFVVGVQVAPAVHAVQTPDVQTWFVPQLAPSTSTAPSTHVEVPVAQEVVPAAQGFGFPVQATLAAHVTQAPALHTWFVPQLVPFARFVVVSPQTGVPVEQVLVPATHLFGLVVQDAPAVHAAHAPLLHTWFVPQTEPFVLFTPESTHVEVPVAQDVCQTVHDVDGLQSTPAVQALHAPLLQTRFVPHVVPFAICVVESTQVCAPVAQEVVPARHGFGLVEQEAPAVHAVHVPALQTWFVPQDVPFESRVVVSMQVCTPVAQEVVPATHLFGFVEHAPPAVHAVQAPPLQTRFVPHTVPFDFAVVVSRQVWTPVAQDVTPVLHGSGLVVQPAPAVQALHVPLLQTRFVPQLVPFASAAAESTHVDVPVAQDVVPARHAFGFPEQERPAVQAEQTPLSQTRFVPQLVPFVFGDVWLSTQACVPVVQEVMPFRQRAPGFVVQASPAVHAPQTPPLQTMFVPQVVPSVFGVPSTQTDVPVEHEVTPFRQRGSGFVVQATPAVQEAHVPPLQTWFVPHEVPFAIGVAVSTQVWVPVEQEVTPWTHGFGFVEQVVPAVHALHVPEPLQTWFVPQIVPPGAKAAVSVHCDEPEAHDVVPRKHGFGFVLQATPAAHVTHEPALQTWPVPQTVPFGLGDTALSRHTDVPVEHEVTPFRQAGFGFVLQAAFETQAVQAPPLQT